MSETDLAELSMAFGALQVDARLQYGLSQLVRQLDERYVTVSDFDGYLKDAVEQRQCEWERMMEHSHDNGQVIFPLAESTGPCQPATEPAINIVLCEDGQDEQLVSIETDDGKSINIGKRIVYRELTRLRVTAAEIIAACEPEKVVTKVQPKAKCECVDDGWITDLMDCWDHAYPKFCCYCGLPLGGKEEKP